MEIGNITIPDKYLEFTIEEKNVVLDKLIDVMLIILEKDLAYFPEINRMTFLVKCLNDLIAFNEKLENYEMCHIISDVVKRINET